MVTTDGAREVQVREGGVQRWVSAHPDAPVVQDRGVNDYVWRIVALEYGWGATVTAPRTTCIASKPALQVVRLLEHGSMNRDLW